VRLRNLLRPRIDEVDVAVSGSHGNDQVEEADIDQRLSLKDLEWLNRVEQLVLSHIDDKRLGVEFMATELYMSSRHLSRRLKALTGLNASQYIQEVKLQKARELLENRECLTVKEAAYAVGFGKPEYFSSLFSSRFGKRPSSFLN